MVGTLSLGSLWLKTRIERTDDKMDKHQDIYEDLFTGVGSSARTVEG